MKMVNSNNQIRTVRNKTEEFSKRRKNKYAD